MKQSLPNCIQPDVAGFGQVAAPPPILVKFKACRTMYHSAEQMTDATIFNVDPSPFKTVRNFVFALLQYSNTSIEISIAD